jgi:Flp pilus assembly protein TadG
MRFPTTSRLLRAEHGQAAVEFALILPLILFFLFLIVEGGRAMEQKNDLSQLAADGARMAAVGRLPDPTTLKDQADTTQLRQNVQITVTVCGGSPVTCVPWPTACPTVGKTVRVTTQAPISFIPISKIASPITIRGVAEMRIEREQSTCP